MFFLLLFFTFIRCTKTLNSLRLWTTSDSEPENSSSERKRRSFQKHNSTPPSCGFSHLHIILLIESRLREKRYYLHQRHAAADKIVALPHKRKTSKGKINSYATIIRSGKQNPTQDMMFQHQTGTPVTYISKGNFFSHTYKVLTSRYFEHPTPHHIKQLDQLQAHSYSITPPQYYNLWVTTNNNIPLLPLNTCILRTLKPKKAPNA